MRVLLTGHQGYVGTVMAPILAAAGHEVTGLDSGLFAGCVLGSLDVPDAPTLAVDLRDVTVQQLEGFDAVVHMAALSNDPLGSLAAEITYDINHHASTRLARLAKDAGVRRFVYAGRRRLRAGVDAQHHGVRVLPAAAGGHRAEQPGRPRVAVQHVRVLSDGTPWRPLTHAGDIAQAVVVALDAPADVVRARAYKIGTERNNRTVAEIAASVVDAVPGSELLITGETGNDPRSYRVDFSRARKELGYEAQWTIPDGAAQLAQEYRARG